jgi:hypothetical protein
MTKKNGLHNVVPVNRCQTASLGDEHLYCLRGLSGQRQHATYIYQRKLPLCRGPLFARQSDSLFRL